MSPELPPPRLAGRLVLKALLGGLLILCLTSAAVASAVLLKVDGIVKDHDNGLGQTPAAPFKAGVVTKAKPGEPQTLLVVGTDRRYGAGRGEANSDTMMLVRLDPKQEATAVLNVPRDLVVEIPGHGRGKINSAYALGGLSLVTETVKATLGLEKVHHAMAVDFKGFRSVVNSLNCIYTDVDRDYFNDRTGPGGYAAIDVDEGYQRLCGQRALDYVRYRHTDSDFVRAARQQTFLRDAKDQVGTGALIDRFEELIDIFGRSTQTDPGLHDTGQVLRLLKQGALSAGKPVRQVKFPGDFALDERDGGLGSYVTASPYALEQTRERFLAATREKQRLVRPQAVKDGAGRARRGARTTLADFGLLDAKRQGEDLIAPLEAKDAVDFPMYFPQGITKRARWTGSPPEPRTYRLRDRGEKEHDAYRLVFTQDELNGDFYGVQGTTWASPPILAQGGERLRMRGRDYRLFYDGRKLRIVAWRTKSATYWVSNSLGLALTNTEMLGIARSLTRVGA
ncbi:MAG: LytR family transcriptional regulator [Solirubrobacterales bacterium]|nr:LytR family transcriptional regulator [Solirubrobacterales bacterium]